MIHPASAIELNFCSQLAQGERTVLYTIAVILLVMWALGLVSGTTIGGFVHVLLVIAVVMVLLQLISGRRVS
jgi:hypothetical protein